MSEIIKCESCGKEISNKTEVEYSQYLSAFFCNFDCAVEHFMDYMQCTPFSFDPHEMKGKQVRLVRGKLHRNY